MNVQILSPFSGFTLMGIASLVMMRYVDDGFKWALLVFAGLCIAAAWIGDFSHQKYKNNFEKEKEVAVENAKKGKTNN